MPSLLELPAEIRNNIYFRLLANRSQVYLEGSSKSPSSMVKPSILQTNRQLRREGMPIWRGNNTFGLMRRDYG